MGEPSKWRVEGALGARGGRVGCCSSCRVEGDEAVRLGRLERYDGVPLSVGSTGGRRKM